MAADWLPAVTAGIAAGAALGGQAIAGWLQGRNQERVEARQRRDRAAEVLAEVRAFLVDASPQQLGMNVEKEPPPEVLVELGERRDRIRIPLLTLAGSHPSPHVRRLAQQLEVELTSLLRVAGEYVTELRQRDWVPLWFRDRANQHHKEALGLLDQLLDAIHEPEAGRPVGGGPFWRRRELPGHEGAR